MSVGIFDSGVGGLSVLEQVVALMGDQAITYVADQAWAPYGERSLGDVRRRSVAITRHLIAEGAEVVVLACNSASAAALHHLRAEFPEVPFVGMEPAVKPAALSTASGVIGVMATTATFQGELFATVVDRHATDVRVVTQACPGLAAMVEDGLVSGPVATAAVANFVRPLLDAGADVIALGCTHYTFLAPIVRDIAGPAVRVIDPAPAVARQVQRMVQEPRPGGVQLTTTGVPGELAAALARLVPSLARTDVAHVVVGSAVA